MDPTQDQAPFDRFAETLSALGWIDRTALLILLVCFVAGLFRGFVWQVSRILILVIAYVAAISFGPELAVVTARWFPTSIPERVPLFVAWLLLFVAAVVAVSLLTRLLQHLVDRSGLSFANRLGGGLLGFATGGLLVMALLTGLHVLNTSLGTGDSVVHAARKSRSQELSYDVLRLASRVVPDSWRAMPDGWRELMRDPTLPDDGSGEPGPEPRSR